MFTYSILETEVGKLCPLTLKASIHPEINLVLYGIHQKFSTFWTRKEPQAKYICSPLILNLLRPFMLIALAMVCLGFLLGCKRSHSIKAYILSALVIIAILCGLRILRYIIYRLLKREHCNSEEHPNDGLEMQLEEISTPQSQVHRICLRRGLSESKFLILKREAHASYSFLSQHISS